MILTSTKEMKHEPEIEPAPDWPSTRNTTGQLGDETLGTIKNHGSIAQTLIKATAQPGAKPSTLEDMILRRKWPEWIHRETSTVDRSTNRPKATTFTLRQPTLDPQLSTDPRPSTQGPRPSTQGPRPSTTRPSTKGPRPTTFGHPLSTFDQRTKNPRLGTLGQEMLTIDQGSSTSTSRPKRSPIDHPSSTKALDHHPSTSTRPTRPASSTIHQANMTSHSWPPKEEVQGCFQEQRPDQEHKPKESNLKEKELQTVDIWIKPIDHMPRSRTKELKNTISRMLQVLEPPKDKLGPLVLIQA